MASDDLPPAPPKQRAGSAALGWAAIALGVLAFILLGGLRDFSVDRPAWNVLTGAPVAIAAFVFAIIAFRRRASGPLAIAIVALVVGSLALLASAGGILDRRDQADAQRACNALDDAWVDTVLPGIAAYREAALDISGDKNFASRPLRDQVVIAQRTMEPAIAVGETASRAEICDERLLPYNRAVIRVGDRAEDLSNAADALLVEIDSQGLRDRYAAAADALDEAERDLEREGLALSELIRQSRGD